MDNKFELVCLDGLDELSRDDRIDAINRGIETLRHKRKDEVGATLSNSRTKITVGDIQQAHDKAVRDSIEGNCVMITNDAHVHRGILLLENQILMDIIEGKFGKPFAVDVINELANAYADIDSYMEINKSLCAENVYWQKQLEDKGFKLDF